MVPARTLGNAPRRIGAHADTLPRIVAIGGGVSKVVRVGELPLKLEVAAYYNAIRPTANQDPWLLQATLTFVFSEPQTRPVIRKEP